MNVRSRRSRKLVAVLATVAAAATIATAAPAAAATRKADPNGSVSQVEVQKAPRHANNWEW